MGWVASLLMLFGAWLLAEKFAAGFACGAIGNVLWGWVALKRNRQWDLLAISVVFVVVDIYGLARWLR